MENLSVEFIIFISCVASIAIPCIYGIWRKKPQFLLLAASVTFSLCLTEIALRLYYPQINESDKICKFDPKFGWKFIPSKRSSIVYPEEVNHVIEINAQGFRDPSKIMSGRTKKLWILGDSFVSNISVEPNEIFTELMEARLSNVDVQNFGVNGYNQVQEYFLLNEILQQSKPKAIIVVIYVRNDFEENANTGWYYPRPYASVGESGEDLVLHPPDKYTPNTTSENTWAFYRKSHLCIFLHIAATNLQMRLKGPQETAFPSPNTIPESYLCLKHPTEKTEKLFKLTELLIAKIAATADQQNIPIIFAVAPSLVQVEEKLWSKVFGDPSDSNSSYSKSAPNDRLMKFGRDHGLRMCDLLPPLQAADQKGIKCYNRLEQHWTREGNLVVANALLAYLDEHKTLSQ